MVPKEVSIEKETFTEPGGQSGIADRLFSHVSTLVRTTVRLFEFPKIYTIVNLRLIGKNYCIASK